MLCGQFGRGHCPLTSAGRRSRNTPRNELRVSIRPITGEARRLLFFLTPASSDRPQPWRGRVTTNALSLRKRDRTHVDLEFARWLQYSHAFHLSR